MIQKLSHATIYVLDQEQALDFYTKDGCWVLDVGQRCEAQHPTSYLGMHSYGVAQLRSGFVILREAKDLWF